MRYIGIDPGLYGAVAALDRKGRLIEVVDTPTLKPKGKGKAAYIPAQMAAVIRRLTEGRDVAVVGLEKIGAMPGQGVSSMFRMGEGFGLWQGIIAALGLPLEMVVPAVWKRVMNVSADKNISIAAAQRIIPTAAPYLTRKKDDGRAEAILIAEFYRRQRRQGI